MSTPARRPTRLVGDAVNSGNVNTGELNMTLGGGQCVTPIFSGSTGVWSPQTTPGAFSPASGSSNDVLIYSGAGRLKDIIVIGPPLQSGQAIYAYDCGNAPVSGGPIAASGHKLVGYIPSSPPALQSGTGVAPGLYAFDVPFQSGLCVRWSSGSPGFSVTYTPETNPVYAT